MTIECDVLVVGGGPAGCSAARAAAKQGAKTILIEEHPEIGMPVQCAEGIGVYLFKKMPFEIPKKQLEWKIKGMYFWANNIAIKKEGKIWSGYSINRTNWDQWLASLAEKEGVKIYLNTKLEKIIKKNDIEKYEVITNSNGKQKNFHPKYIVGADGSESTVIEILNKKKRDYLLGYVKSYEMENVKLIYPYYDQLFFGQFAPKAYAYIFPLSKNRANIGVGTINQKDNLDKLFKKFTNIPLVKKQIKNAKILIEKSGNAPISNISEKISYGNIFLVGDAANQNIKPFLEGNIPSIICGDLLGKFIKNVDQGINKPEEYKKFINKKFNWIKKSQKYADIILKEMGVSNEIFNLLLLGLSSEIIPPKDKKIKKYISKGPGHIKELILKNGGFIEK